MVNMYLEYTKNPNAAMVSNIEPRPITIYDETISRTINWGISGLTI